jgi:hypothetical protein
MFMKFPRHFNNICTDLVSENVGELQNHKSKCMQLTLIRGECVCRLTTRKKENKALTLRHSSAYASKKACQSGVHAVNLHVRVQRPLNLRGIMDSFGCITEYGCRTTAFHIGTKSSGCQRDSLSQRCIIAKELFAQHN